MYLKSKLCIFVLLTLFCHDAYSEKIDGNNQSEILKKVKTLFLENRFVSCNEYIQTILKDTITSNKVNFDIAYFLEEMNLFETAEQVYLNMLKVDPKNSIINEKLAMLYLKMNQPHKGIEIWKEIGNSGELSESQKFNRVKLYFGNQEYENANKLLSDVMLTEDIKSDYWLYLALIAFKPSTYILAFSVTPFKTSGVLTVSNTA